MKIARSPEGLQKPRGFHNHWDMGKALKAQEEAVLQRHEQSKAKPGHKAINILGDRVTGLGYTVAKKSKDLWQGEGRIAELKSEKSDCLKELNSLASDIKTIKLLFSNNPDELLRQHRLNGDKRVKLKKALAITDKLLSELE